MSDLLWMREALAEGWKALEAGEIPVGAVLVRRGEILGRAHNLRESRRDPLAHAETLALRRAARRAGDWRLEESVLYVTLEPCPMCAGALLQSRVQRLVYGAENLRMGCAGTLLNLADYPGLDHQVQVTAGILGDECRGLLESFFAARRGKAPGSASRPGEVAEPG